MKKIMFVMPLMAMSLLASCGSKTSTYTITFKCSNCKALDENDNEITTIDVSTDTSYTTYRKFYLKGNSGYHQPLNNLISVEKTSGKEPITDYSYKGTDGSIILPITSDLTITAHGFLGKTLEEYSWNEIQQISKEGRAKEFFDIYDSTKPELNCKRVQLRHQDLDNNGEIDENEVYQTVRIIGFDQDYTNPNNRDNTKVGITFEFADLISDASGYSLAAIWNNVLPENSNYRYDTSTIRECLNGSTSGNAVWYEKGGTTKSNNYKDSVLHMLPDDLIDVIVPVSKNVNINYGDGFKEYPIKDPLFLLTYKEMGWEKRLMEIDVPVYQYYEGHTEEKDTIRIKRQVKGEVGALTTTTTIEQSDITYGVPGTSYAGFNSNNPYATCNGGRCWLRNPDKNGNSNACCIEDINATMNSYASFYFAHGVAPAFCI